MVDAGRIVRRRLFYLWPTLTRRGRVPRPFLDFEISNTEIDVGSIGLQISRSSFDQWGVGVEGGICRLARPCHFRPPELDRSFEIRVTDMMHVGKKRRFVVDVAPARTECKDTHTQKTATLMR